MKLLLESWRGFIKEELLQEVTFEDAQKTMRDRGVKFIKAYNYDQGFDPKKNLGSLSTGLENRILSLIPSDIEDNQKGTSLLWVLRLLKDHPKLKEIILKTVVDPVAWDMGRAAYNAEFGNIRNNLETFFQFQRLMDPTDIFKLPDADSLTNVVAGARASIEAAKDKALSANAPKGAEFFKGNFKFAEDGSVARDEEGLPEFQSEGGWVIAAAHNKGAACLLGKKTRWCTAAPGLNYFDTYYGGEDDPLFFLMDPHGNRYQFAYGQKEFMDVDNDAVERDYRIELQEKLKEVLAEKDLEDKYSIVFEYEDIDYEEKVKEIVEENEKRIDDNRISISGDVDAFDEEPMIMGSFDATYLFSLPSDYDGVQDLEKESYNMIEDAFNKIMDNSPILGDQEDSYGDPTDNIYFDFGGGLLKVQMSGHFRGYGDHGLEGLDSFFENTVDALEDKYDAVRNMLRETLIIEQVLPATKYDKMFFDIYETDEEGEEIETDKKDLKEKFELSLDNISISIDEEEGTIKFSLSFPTPKALRTGSLIGRRPKNKELIMQTANKRTIDSLNRQLDLPSLEVDKSAEEEALEMLSHITNRNQRIEIEMLVGHRTTHFDFVLNINDLDEDEIDQVVTSFGVIDENIEAYKRALYDSFTKYIEKYPAEFPTPEPKEPPRYRLQESRRKIKITIGDRT